MLIPMEYIFIDAKKDVITEKNDEIKNLEEKRKLRQCVISTLRLLW